MKTLSYKTIPLSDFLFHVEEIAAENPSYRIGGSGSDGTCDCIGLIMGAIRRSGGKWPWLHSSNDAARKAVQSLAPISRVADLSAGDLVFRHLKPGERGYNLPNRYVGDPDPNDYTHVGIVLSVDPLRIRHMTSPSVKLDTKLGRWSHRGWCSLIRKKKAGPADSAGFAGSTGIPDSPVSAAFSASLSGSGLSAAHQPGAPAPKKQSTKKGGTLPMVENITIESTNGLPVKLRSRPSTSCPLYWTVPSGASGILLSSEGGWSRLETEDLSGAARTGWVRDEFVVRPSPARTPLDPRRLSAEESSAILSAAEEMDRQLNIIFEVMGGRG